MSTSLPTSFVAFFTAIVNRRFRCIPTYGLCAIHCSSPATLLQCGPLNHHISPDLVIVFLPDNRQNTQVFIHKGMTNALHTSKLAWKVIRSCLIVIASIYVLSVGCYL